LISLFDLEKQLALSDIVTGLSSFYLFNDPALSKRLKAFNPNIVCFHPPRHTPSASPRICAT
jgi:hypothetical protein